MDWKTIRVPRKWHFEAAPGQKSDLNDSGRPLSQIGRTFLEKYTGPALRVLQLRIYQRSDLSRIARSHQIDHKNAKLNYHRLYP